MPNERFPRQRYIRELAAIRNDLIQWRYTYQQAEKDTTSSYFSARFASRAAVLDDALDHLNKLADTLAALPRVT